MSKHEEISLMVAPQTRYSKVKRIDGDVVAVVDIHFVHGD